MTEYEAIEELKLDNEKCYEQCEGACLSIKNYECNCQDAVIERMLNELLHYREMDRKLREAFGDCDGLLETAVEGFCKHSGVDIGNPIKARLLTDEDVDKWDDYRKIGTVEECREAVEKQKAKKVVYKSDSVFCDGFTHYRMGKCPVCDRWHNNNDEVNYCSKCGQKIQWSENLEEV